MDEFTKVSQLPAKTNTTVDANAADTDYAFHEASATAEVDGWQAKQVPSIERQLKEHAKKRGPATDLSQTLRQPTEYKSDLEIKQEAYEDGTPWYQYVRDRLKTGTLRIGAGMDATEILATAKILDGFDDIKNGKLSKRDLHSDGHVASARVSRLQRYLRADPDERMEMEIEMGEKLASAVQGAWQSTAEADAIPSSPITRAALGAENISEFWKYFEKYPMAVIGHYVLENVPKEALAAAGTTVGGLVAGLKALNDL
jgi:hypothetical protein